MKLKRTAHTIDTEELLDVVENVTTEDKPEEVINYKNNVVEFLSVFDITPGRSRIKNHTLYQIYKVWSKEPVKKSEFYTEVKNYLPITNIGNAHGYSINFNAIKLTHEAYTKFKKERKKLKSKTWAKHFEDFLSFHSLTPGEVWLDSRILYFIYDKYCHELGIDNIPNSYMSNEVFNTYAKIYFKYKIQKQYNVYGVSENIQNFFQEGQLERMKRDYVKKKKPKKRSKIRRSRSKVQSKDPNGSN